ncbi:MAG: hypothetical protein DDT24_00391 [Chloroflexi bacterium]|nr:hypothetical protein [Chloroflexota bacterium]
MFTDPRVRKAKIKDLPRITELAVALLKYHENFDPYFTPDKDVKAVYHKFFKTCVYSPKRLLLVAEPNSEIVGYALGESTSRLPIFKIRTIGVINDMFVVDPCLTPFGPDRLTGTILKVACLA